MARHPNPISRTLNPTIRNHVVNCWIVKKCQTENTNQEEDSNTAQKTSYSNKIGQYSEWPEAKAHST